MELSDIKFSEDLPQSITNSTPMTVPSVITSILEAPESMAVAPPVITSMYEPRGMMDIPPIITSSAVSDEFWIFSFVMSMIFLVVLLWMALRWCFVRRVRVRRAFNELLHDIEGGQYDGQQVNQMPEGQQPVQVDGDGHPSAQRDDSGQSHPQMTGDSQSSFRIIGDGRKASHMNGRQSTQNVEGHH